MNKIIISAILLCFYLFSSAIAFGAPASDSIKHLDNQGNLNMQLASMTWKQSENFMNENILAIIPVGAVEQHGSLGPLGTDYLIPDYIAKTLAEKRSDIVVLPTMPYGNSFYHLGFKGTINIGHDALYSVLDSISSSLMKHGVRRFLFLNGHGGNGPAITEVGNKLSSQGALVAQIDWWSLAPKLNKAWLGGHGAAQEASAMMVVNPDWVSMENYSPTEMHHLSDKLKSTSASGVNFDKGSVKIFRMSRDITSSGSYGPDESSKANPQWGKEMLDAVISYIDSFIDEFNKVNLK